MKTSAKYFGLAVGPRPGLGQLGDAISARVVANVLWEKNVCY